MTPTVSPIPTPTPTPAFEKGDVDCDGDFDAVDALNVLRTFRDEFRSGSDYISPLLRFERLRDRLMVRR